tara:strand:- start:1883 stop:2830 length:948 start_codon:yes stop_codon:yes gene_type:complete
MRQFPKASSFILAALYLLIINQYALDLYLGAVSSDIYNYIYNIGKTLEQGTILDNKWYFYTVIFYFNSWFDIRDPYTIYLSIASISIFLLSYKLFQNVFHSKKRLISFILIVLILFTPSVFELIVSNIRSGGAFILFLYGIKSNSRSIKLILISMSVLTHLMILPILCFYILFYFLKKTGFIRRSTFFSILFLIFFSFILCLLIKFNRSTGVYQYSFLYTTLVYFITIMYIYYNSKAVKNEDGFVAIGLMLMISISPFLDINIMRYLGIAFILYGIFIINNNNINILKKYTSIYFVLIIIYQFYFFKTLLFYGYI